jgi:hypothetical protein
MHGQQNTKRINEIKKAFKEKHPHPLGSIAMWTNSAICTWCNEIASGLTMR